MVEKYPGLTKRQSAEGSSPGRTSAPGTPTSVTVFMPDSGNALVVATLITPGSA